MMPVEGATMKLFTITAGVLLLAACGKEAEVDARNASVDEVARQVGAAADSSDFVRPGKWTSTVTIQELSAPGMPPQLVEQMKAHMGRSQTSESCLTEEQAKRPSAEFFGGKNEQCRYDHFTMGGGKIDATMRCSEQGATSVMEMAGTYSPETYSMTMKTTVEGGGAPAGTTMRMKVESRRIGECAEKQG